METMTLTINLPEEVSTVLKRKAKTSGKGVKEYVETMITTQLKRPTLRDLFADVRNEITVSDEDLEKRIDTAIEESRKTRR